MTLRKMYLVPAADDDNSSPYTQPPPPPPQEKRRPRVRKGRAAKRERTDNRHPHDKCVALHRKLVEAGINESEIIHRLADFLRKVLPPPAIQKTPQRQLSAEQRPKRETVEIALKPQHSLVAQRPEPPFADVASTS